MKTGKLGGVVLSGSFALMLCMASGCQKNGAQREHSTRPVSTPMPKARELALAPQPGQDRLDLEIRQLQQRIQKNQNPVGNLEKLGWMFVLKARTAFDPGFYKQAEACADAIAAEAPESLEAMLLKGHVLQNLHHFKEAEPLAMTLVTRRGLPFDFGLLGDVLMEQGQIRQATQAYQKMMDSKPDMHAYARAAHIRWLKGDLQGAREAMRMAARASSPRDPEGAAWTYTRLAFYEWQSGTDDDARLACRAALELQADYPPALLLQGRMLLGQNKNQEATVPLRKAAQANPLPEYQWTLLEALVAAGESDGAARVRSELKAKGAVTDPRTFALFLATHAESADLAIRLAEKELKERRDVFTYDALAWAQAAAGKWAEAYQSSRQALSEGTQDARLLLHAAVIAGRSDHGAEARELLARAAQLRAFLLPSELACLNSAQIMASSTRSPAMAVTK